MFQKLNGTVARTEIHINTTHKNKMKIKYHQVSPSHTYCVSQNAPTLKQYSSKL